MLEGKAARRGLRARSRAPVFAALGDETRLALVARLCGGESYSITELAEYCATRSGGTRLTRQAVTKHLRVLEGAGIVRCTRRGRESVFAFEPEPVEEMREVLDFMSRRWDEALGRLKRLVEG
jgi:DNA-binding transcriptional ArsR family regulator